MRADPLRGVETVEHAARRLQKQIIHVVKRAAELDHAFRSLGSRVTVGKAVEALEASGQLPGISQEVLEDLWNMEVNLLVSDIERPE